MAMVENNLYPDFFARFYDVIYDHVRSSADYNFYMQKIREADGPVLEVGVGTGRFFIDALEGGADIYGVDISPAMVAVLHSKLPHEEHSRVKVGDICDMNESGKYRLIIAPFRVFMHLLTVEKQLAALSVMHNMLLPGGRLVFDLFIPNLKRLSEGIHDHVDFDGEYMPGRFLRRYTSMQADPVNQVSNVTFRLEWDENGKIKSESWNTSLRLFFRYELEHLLSRSAFSRYEIFGDFLGNPLTASSKEFVVECIAG